MVTARFSQTAQDIVMRLRQNSQNQLQKLRLPGISLDDRRFLSIVELLPTSRIEVFDIAKNDIEAQGILALATQLSNIKS